MNVELRNFKSFPAMSEETLAFRATLYIDGRRAADAANDGHGGPSYARFVDRALEQRFNDYCKALPPEKSEYGDIAMNADCYLSTLAERADKAAWFKRQSRAKVLFRRPTTGEDKYDTVGHKPGQRDAAIAHVRAKYPDAVIFDVDGTPLSPITAVAK